MKTTINNNKKLINDFKIIKIQKINMKFKKRIYKKQKDKAIAKINCIGYKNLLIVNKKRFKSFIYKLKIIITISKIRLNHILETKLIFHLKKVKVKRKLKKEFIKKL